ncbi:MULTISPECIES: ammonia-forming cytochrome c nitrite reductase subunit c552 [unclassified Candidatus Frackibacter]|uniref:ammonia-forming cytochrome c nitrite reductase subunit c552 n=1 Tax=unclassified Candidatus Frackibacter TaxID=2648818 RepID=UPI0008911F9A|nr:MULTISPECIES: ammonia-forming cytochrome c nitrite reductase subunit c552 [unclassified Candidatus Frackibacter]SDC12353.1 Cytochrome c552 [Candidatus Frackibacter sp. WG11]SEM35900.1 Cytochrome c552 [Candidatus Frackibacter sp. WG12]SFL41116.1 Cytochrome c552 [Candidatus Frackibacter sp. WG13]
MKKFKLLLLMGLVVVVGLGLFSQSVMAGVNGSKRCMNCHREETVSWKESAHANKQIKCLSCHKRNMSLRKSKEKLCVQCHTAGDIKPGESIGMPQKEMNAGVGGFGVEKAMPEGMYSVGVTCIDCHMPDGKRHTFKIVMPKQAKEGKTDACISCHTIFQPEIMQNAVDDWQNNTINLLAKVKKLLKKKEEFKDHELYKKAEINYRFVKKDGSKGAHNPDYAQKLLRISVRMLESLR